MVDSKKSISLNNLILLDNDQKNKIRRNKSLSDLTLNDQENFENSDKLFKENELLF